MTDLRTRPLPDLDQPPEPPHRDDSVGLRDVWHWVNRVLTSKHTGLGLILGMAALTLLGTLLTQAPDSVRDDPAAYQSWVDSLRPKYGGWTDVLDRLGMFHMFGSLWFKIIALLLCLSIIACTVHRIPTLWQRAMHPHLHVREPFFDHAVLRDTFVIDEPADAALERVSAALRGQRYRVVTDPKDPRHSVYADRFRFMPFGTSLAHTAFVLIILGVVVTGAMGFRNNEFTITVGTTAPVGHGTGLSVEAKSFSDTYYADGRPQDYASELVLYSDGVQVAEQTVRVNHPLRYDGVTFYQSYFGVSAIVKVTDAAGAVVFDGGVPLQYSSPDDQESIGKLHLAAQQREVYVVTAASGQVNSDIAPGQLLVEVYREGQDRPVGQEKISQGGSATVDGLTYTFVRERQFTGLIAARDPGAVLVWIGSGLMMVGLMTTLFLRHRRIWVRVHPDGPAHATVRIASPERHHLAYETWFRRFVSGLSTPVAARHDKE